MTEAQVIAMIQQYIVENHNEEITANVLRPILETMVSQPNDLIGDLDNLTTTYKNDLVGAINEVHTLSQNGLTIHYGADLPNDVPPAGQALGDFYAQIDNTDVISFWQYNGNEWVEIKEDTGGVQSVTGDGVGGTPDNPVLNFPKEEEITGTRLTNASVSGSTSLDWDSYKVFEFTLTGATTLTDLNLPTVTETKVIELVITGDFVLTLPAYWEALPSNDAYDGLKRNHLVVSCINGDTNDVIYSLQNLAT